MQITPHHTPLTIQVSLMMIPGNIAQQQMGNEMSIVPPLFFNLFL